MEDIKDSLMWLGMLDLLSLVNAVLYLWAAKSSAALVGWAWLNVGFLTAFSLVVLTFAIISVIIGIEKIMKKGE